MAASTLRASGARAVQRRNVSAAAGSPSATANVVAAPISRRPSRSSAAVAAVAAAPAIASVNAVRKLASSSRASVAARAAIRDGASLDGRKLRVAVIGGGPSGACAAETLAKGGIETFLIERKMDNCKVRAVRGERLERERDRGAEKQREKARVPEIDQCLVPLPASLHVARCFGRGVSGRRGLQLLCGPATPMRDIESYALVREGSVERHRQIADGAV